MNRCPKCLSPFSTLAVKCSDCGWDPLGLGSDSVENACVGRVLSDSIPTIVCLCGSTRFYQAFQEANYRETMDGKIVLSVGFYPHAQKEMHGEEVVCTDEQKELLDELHKRKIDLADEVLVLNVDGYVGESTRSEVEYALDLGKPIRWLEGFSEEDWPVGGVPKSLKEKNDD